MQDYPNGPAPDKSPFDPSRHITTLSRRQRLPDGSWKNVDLSYMEVKYRLLWLRSVEPAARIQTDLVKHEGDLAIFRAHVILPNGAEATGYGSETAGDWGDFIEKAETKALGRALAALGFGTQFVDDFDLEQQPSQQNRQRLADTPVERPKASAPISPAASAPSRPTPPQTTSAPHSSGSPSGGGSQPATDKQRRAIGIMARNAGLDDSSLAMFLGNRGFPPLDSLTLSQASSVIDSLKSYAGGGPRDVQPVAAPPSRATGEQAQNIRDLFLQFGVLPDRWGEVLEDYHVADPKDLSWADADELIRDLVKRLHDAQEGQA